MKVEQDVANIRAFNKRGGERGIAQAYGRVVAQVGKKKCAELVECSVTTVTRYTKTLDMLADAGYIAHVKDFTADTDYDFDAVGVTQKVWDEFYEAMRYTRKDGRKISKRQPGLQETLDALDDPVKEAAARKKLARKTAKRKLDKAKRQASQEPTDTAEEQLVDWMAGARKVEKDLAELVGLTSDLPKDAGARQIVLGTLDELRVNTTRYLDAIASLAEGNSMDDELAALLSGGVE